MVKPIFLVKFITYKVYQVINSQFVNFCLAIKNRIYDCLFRLDSNKICFNKKGLGGSFSSIKNARLRSGFCDVERLAF